MAYLVVGGVTVPVAAEGGAEGEMVEVGEIVRSFDGTPRSSVRAYGSDHTITTVPIPASQAQSLLAALQGAHPISCSGDMFGATVSCTPTEIRTSAVKIVGTTAHTVVTFRLLTAP